MNPQNTNSHLRYTYFRQQGGVCMGVGIDKILLIPMPLSILPIGPILYRFSYRFLLMIHVVKHTTQVFSISATVLLSLNTVYLYSIDFHLSFQRQNLDK